MMVDGKESHPFWTPLIFDTAGEFNLVGDNNYWHSVPVHLCNRDNLPEDPTNILRGLIQNISHNH